jgi:hypothetical protein
VSNVTRLSKLIADIPPVLRGASAHLEALSSSLSDSSVLGARGISIRQDARDHVRTPFSGLLGCEILFE